MSKSRANQSNLFVLRLLATVVLFLSVFFSYHSFLDAPLVFDTPLNLSVSQVARFFPSPSWRELFFKDRFFVWMTFGMQAHLDAFTPVALRTWNVVFHALNSVLIFWLFQSLLLLFRSDGTKSNVKHQLIISAFAGILFGIHPISIYSVTYVIQRFGVMALFFGLLSTLSFVRFIKKPIWIWGCLSVLFYFLATHSKEHIVMLPVLFAGMILFIPKPIKDIKRYVALGVGYGLVAIQTILMVKKVILTTYEPNAPVMMGEFAKSQQMDLGSMSMYLNSVFNQAWYFFRYLFLWILPLPQKLSLDTPLPFLSDRASGLYWIGPFLMLGLIAFGVLLWKRGGRFRYALIPVLACLVLFLPEFSTVRFHENFVLYRSYLFAVPLLGVFLFSTIDVCDKNRRYLYMGMCLWCLSLLGVQQNRLIPFRNELELWKDAIAKIDLKDRRIPASYRTAGNLATGLGTVGQLEESKKYYLIASELNPSYVKAWDGIGAAMALQGQLDEAVIYFRKAIQVEPAYKDAYYNLGTLLSNQKKYDEAIQVFTQALKIYPDYQEVLYNLGNAYLRSGKVKEAIAQYEKAVNLNPANIDAYHNLGIAYGQSKEFDKAILAFDHVLKLNPRHTTAHYSRANNLAALKRYQEAYDEFTIALSIDSNHLYALYNMSLVCLQMKKYEEAMKHANKLMSIAPQFVPVQKLIERIQDQKQQASHLSES